MGVLQKMFPYFARDDGTPMAVSSPAVSNDLRFGSEIQRLNPLPAAPGVYGLHWNGEPGLVRTPDGRTVSYAGLFATQPWVHATVARYLHWADLVPVKVYRRVDDKTRQRLGPRDHPFAKAVLNPWPGANGNDLFKSILGSVLVHGNSAVEVESGANGAIRFVPLDWRNVTPQMVSAHYVSGWSFDDETYEESRIVTPERMVHVTWANICGPLGVSPLNALGTTLSNEIAAQLYGINSLKNGARPSGSIKTDAELYGGMEQEERDQLLADIRQQVTQLYSGPANAGVPAILPPGMEWQTMAHTAQEAVLIEQRKLNREEVEGVYLMPPPLVGQLDHATYSNIETQKEMGYADTLGPQAVKIASAITSQVANDLLGEDDLYVEIDLNAVLRGNPLAMSEQLQRLFNMGVLSRNEVRALMNLDRIPADVDPTADSYFVQANNMAPAETLANNNTESDG